MVAPIGETVNKFIFPTSFSTTIQSNNKQTLIPSVNVFSNTEMNQSTGTNPVNNNDVRGRSPKIHKNWSRDSSMFSMISSTIYHERMEINNSIDIDSDPPAESPILSYKDERDKEICLMKAAKTTNNMRLQSGNNKASSTLTNYDNYASSDNVHIQPPHVDDNNIINIQLSYDPNGSTEPNLWSGNFQSISLHSLVKHIVSDLKNIKQSLNFMVKYISNKKVNPKSSNDLEDFNSIGDMVWNFLSSVYQSSWDSLYTDNHSKSLRKKISAKLTPKVVPLTTNKTTKNPNPVTINKAPPLPSLLAKSKKKVNIISKYFLPNKPSVNNNINGNSNNSGKSYAQAIKLSTNMSEVLKIKETFPSLNAQKVDQVQNIVNGQARSKPHIKMMTKGLSRKQVIIPMSRENISSFMKSSSLHVANLNRLLHNAKSEVFTDYIHANPIGITIVTNKVSQQLDMAIINNYVKSLNDINSLQVDEPHLPKSKSYLKIIGIPFYPHANSQERLTPNDIETILKQNHIFDNISLGSKPRVIKISPKSDMSVVWLDIWDIQSSSNAKMLINRCFNVRNYIATIRGANMNPSVP